MQGELYYSTSVPPEWHAWLLRMNMDTPPTQLNLEKPVYSEEYRPLTVHGWGTDKRYGDDKMYAEAYFPKGSAVQTEQGRKMRNWSKIETWKPRCASGA